MLYGQRFLRYGAIFKIAIFGHETWPLIKVPEVAHIPSFYPRQEGGGREIELILAGDSADIRSNEISLERSLLEKEL